MGGSLLTHTIKNAVDLARNKYRACPYAREADEMSEREIDEAGLPQQKAKLKSVHYFPNFWDIVYCSWYYYISVREKTKQTNDPININHHHGKYSTSHGP